MKNGVVLRSLHTRNKQPAARPQRHAQHGIARGDSLQHIRRAVIILNPGAMDLETYAQSSRIGTNVALAALDLFFRRDVL